MSKLSNFIDEYCTGFDVVMDNSNRNNTVFIEITHLKTLGWLNDTVSLGQEVEGLTMLVIEWELLHENIEFSRTVN